MAKIKKFGTCSGVFNPSILTIFGINEDTFAEKDFLVFLSSLRKQVETEKAKLSEALLKSNL